MRSLLETAKGMILKHASISLQLFLQRQRTREKCDATVLEIREGRVVR